MMKILSICHAAVTLVLLALVLFLLYQHRGTGNPSEVVRTRRLEITDQSGKLRAVVDTNQQDGAAPEVVLLDNKGRQALLMTVNSLGYGTLYFQSQKTEGKVSVGYLWGSDSLPPNTEDPLARWGIRVRGINGMTTSLSLPNDAEVTNP